MMHRHGFSIALVLLAFGCGGGEEPAPVDDAAAEAEDLPALVQEPAAEATPPGAAPAQAPATTTPTSASQRFTPQRDTPFVTADPGAVRPGMSEAAVVAVWGEPVTRSAEGAFTYLFFRNGCEASCGMYDLVILEAGQVVDAVVRFPGHRYEGTSSSPAGSQPVSTPPTMEQLNPPAGN